MRSAVNPSTMATALAALQLLLVIGNASAFQCHPWNVKSAASSAAAASISTSSTLLLAKPSKNNNNNGKGGGAGKGFGAPKPIQNSSGIYSKKSSSSSPATASKNPPKYSLDDKSYGIPPLAIETMEEAHDSMSEFFEVHHEWKPLFRNILGGEDALAHSFLHDNKNDNSNIAENNGEDSSESLWGISTMEGNTPWKILPSKPTDPFHLDTLSKFLDEWQTSLLDIPIDALVKEGSNDLHFLEEGRRTIACTRFHVHGSAEEFANAVLVGSGTSSMSEWEHELFTKCWSEMAHLMSQDTTDTGSLIVLPPHQQQAAAEGGEGEVLPYLQSFIVDKLQRPIQWLGRQDDWEIVAFERGSGAIRMLYKLSEIPDLGERDSGSDEEIAL